MTNIFNKLFSEFDIKQDSAERERELLHTSPPTGRRAISLPA